VQILHCIVLYCINGNIEELVHRKQQKAQKVILSASHWLCGKKIYKFRCHGDESQPW